MTGEPVVDVQLKHVTRKRGRLFWQPKPEMRAMGFEPEALGPDGPEAQARALKLYASWLKAKAEIVKITRYPPGTFGAYWDRFRTTQKWRNKAVRGREDYHRAWVHIDAWRQAQAALAPGEKAEPRVTLSNTVLTRITTDMCEAFFADIDGRLSPSERYRTIKCLKALLQDATVRLKLPYASPAANLTNPQAKGRSDFWLGAEIPLLIAGAEAFGYAGMAILLRIAWDTLFSPVDVWTACKPQLLRDRTGWYIKRDRTKTQKGAFGYLSEETAAAVWAYIEALPFDLAPDAPFIRQRNGNAYRSKDTVGDDFRVVRAHVFPGDKRQLQDIRRSGNLEADVGGADKETMGEILANGLATSAFLNDTYTPPTVAKARDVALQRLTGRARLAEEIERITRGHTVPRSAVK